VAAKSKVPVVILAEDDPEAIEDAYQTVIQAEPEQDKMLRPRLSPQRRELLRHARKRSRIARTQTQGW